MEFPCDDFMEDAGIKEEFYALCENAGLTRLVTSRVPQYETLTAIFVNSFRFYSDNDTGVKGLPMDGDRDLPLPRGRIPGRRCMLPTSLTNHGRTSTTRG